MASEPNADQREEAMVSLVRRLAQHMGAEALLELLTKMADRGDDLALKGGNADTVIRARWHAGRHMESRFDPDYRIS